MAVAWAAWAGLELWTKLLSHPGRHADFLPLWLGARALVGGMDPTDPAVLASLYDASRPLARPGGFLTFYPQSAAMLCLPLAWLDFDAMALGLQVVLGAGLLAGPALAAGSVSRGARLVAAMALAVGISASLAIAVVLVNMGQSNTVLVMLTGLGLWALARDRPVAGGLAIGLGITLKMFPAVLLVPAILARRWRMVLLAAAVPLLLFLSSLLLYSGPWEGSPLGSGTVSFFTEVLHRNWAEREHRVVLAMWHARLWLPGLLAIGLAAWAARVRDAAALPALGALWLAWVGTALAGCGVPHYAIVVLPSAGWLLAWALSARRLWLAIPVLLLVAAVAWWRGIFVHHLAQTLQWLPVCFAVVAGCTASVVDALIPTAGRVRGEVPPGAPPGTS